MRRSTRKRIPVNLIAGPLGVGKTTTINHLLAHRPEGERWAVLVNEYGRVGLDAALMERRSESSDPHRVEIREVAGGCICCTAGIMFQASLVLLLQRRPDRLLIEPTGLATLSGILDTLDSEGIRNAVDVRSVVCLVDPARLEDTESRAEVRDQVEAADVVLASRPDLATGEQRQEFEAWAKALYPAKRFVGHLEHGALPLDILDLVSRGPRARRPEVGHTHDHAHGSTHHTADIATAALPDEQRPLLRHSHEASLASTLGWICWAGWTFDEAQTSSWLMTLAKRPGMRRVKAVLRTTGGWQAFNLVDGIAEVRPSGYRRDSRVEMVLEHARLPNVDELEGELRACLVHAPAGAN